MKQIINVSQRNMNYILNYIAGYKYSSKQIVYIDNRFYNGLCHMSESTINQTLNALQAEDLIYIHAPVSENSFSYITLTDKAFTYRKDKREKAIRYWIPTIISIIALLKAFDVELASLLRLLMQLKK